MAKKKQKKNVFKISPEKYITARARQLPLGKTYISRTVADQGTYIIIVTREHTGGNLTVGLYLIDMYCLGVKDSFYYFSITPEDFKEKVLSNRIIYEEADYAEAHNLIYGALEYAEEAGIMPAREFKVSEYILEPDDERIPLMEFEFGHNGVRELVIGPDYQEMKYIPVLEKNVPGEYIVTGCLDRHLDDQDDDADYEATTGNSDPRSFNFGFHPFPHPPYPENVDDALHVELTDIFYPEDGPQLGSSLDTSQIATVRAIPRDELLADIRLFTDYEFGQAEAEIAEDGCYNLMDSNVMYNICAILAETGGSDTKDLARNILQQSYYWHEAYLGDYGMEIMHSVLANAFEDSPEELARMVVEQGFSAHSRVSMLYALENIAMWNPSVRGRVEEALHTLAELILHDYGSDLPFLNDYMAGTLAYVMISLRMKTSLPLVKEMYERDLVDKDVFGTYEDQLQDLAYIEEEGECIETRFITLEQIYKHYK